MTGCPICGWSFDAQELVFKSSCPHCQAILDRCGPGRCDMRLVSHDGDCEERTYHCGNGRDVFRDRRTAILHHHSPERAA